MFRIFIRLAAAIALLAMPSFEVQAADPSLTLIQALRRALATNPRLTVAEREIGMAVGRRIQAGAVPNPDAGIDVENVFGTGPYRGTSAAESSLFLGQLVELGGKREARIAAGVADVESARWERAAVRLELLSETAVAFYEVLSGQRRVAVYDGQIVALDRILPLLARRVDLGASSPAEIARARLAIELIRAERERARTEIGIARRELANLMGTSVPDFSQVVGELNVTGRPPAFQTVLDALDRNPQLIRWTAVRAQRDAELLSARLKPIPDLRLEAGWRRYRETKDSSYRLGVSIPIPVWDQNQGAIYEAQESLAKTSAERATNKTVLVLTLGRAYENLTGALRELQVLRTSAIPNARIAVEGTETGYTQGRYTLFELLDAQSAAMQAELRVQEVLLNFYTAVAIIEGLTGNPFTLARARSR